MLRGAQSNWFERNQSGLVIAGHTDRFAWAVAIAAAVSTLSAGPCPPGAASQVTARAHDDQTDEGILPVHQIT